MSERLLAIDVGNTITTLGLFEGENLLDQWRLTSHRARTEDEISVALHQLFSVSEYALPSVRRVSISSVDPILTAAYSKMVMHRLGIQPLVITAENVKLLQVDYDPPSSVGSDRLCGGVAAFVKYGGPVVIVDMGTATVFDLISRDGIYRGGLIAPGIATAAESLHQTAAMLPHVDYRFPSEFIGHTTETAIQSGILHGAVAMIDGIVEKIRQNEGESFRVVATGGFARLLSTHSRAIQHVEPDLVLQGIQIVTANQ